MILGGQMVLYSAVRQQFRSRKMFIMLSTKPRECENGLTIRS